MARTLNKLTASKLKSKKPGRYADGGNLYLQITASKTEGAEPFRSWLFLYKSPTTGKYRMMGLGKAGPKDVTLERARDDAKVQRALLRDGKDPLDVQQAEREAKRVASAKPVTFKDVAADYIAAHRESWKNQIHAKQWEQSLRKFAYPKLGPMDVAAITVNHVLDVLRPIWHDDRANGGRIETASRLRGRIEAVLGAAKVRGLRTGENPARWDENLDNLLPSPKKVKKVRHHPALPYDELPPFFKELRQRDGISARALEFLILCASRTSEVIRAKWPEIDLDGKVWTIPAERMKAQREHIVPLPDAAVALLKRLPREDGNEFVFIGGKEGEPLSNMALLELMKEMRPGYVPHGFRSTFKDWASEQTAHPNIVSEAALAHVVADKTEAAYRRGDLLQKRRRLMADWARYCERQLIERAGNVTPLRKRKAS